MQFFSKNKGNHREGDGETIIREVMERMDTPCDGGKPPRTPLTHRLGAKITAFLLVIVLTALAVGCGIAAMVMVEADIYTTPKEIMRKDIFDNLAEDVASSVLGCLLYSDSEQDASDLCRYKNIARVVVSTEGERELSWNYTASTPGTVLTKYTSTWFWYGNDFYYPRDLDGMEDAQEITVSIYLPDVLTKQDEFLLVDRVLGVVYALRYWIYAIAVAALLCAIACFVFLLCASGHRKGFSEPQRGWGTWVPLDALSAGAFILCALLLNICDEAGYFYSWFKQVLVISLCVLALLVLTMGWCMSFSVRIKLGKWWQNTIIYQMFALGMKILRGIFSWSATLLGNLPLVWKTAAMCVLAAFVEAVFSLCSWAEYDVLLVWLVVKNCVWIPAMLFLAFTLRKLQRGARALAQGDLEYKIDTQGLFGDFKTSAEDLGSIGEGMTAAVEQRLRSERMKTELITNVSHDIKTPLTSIINYSDLIEKEPCENGKITEYAAVLHRQSERLKRLIDDLVEASKASTGNLDVQLAPCDVGVMLSQTVGEYEQRLEQCRLTLVTKQPEKSVRIMADGRRLWRVFDNLMNNICKYAMPGTRVYLTLEKTENEAVISFKNTSREALDLSADELMERFVRGDAARNSEGNGLGLSIARSLVQLQNGTLELTVDGDLFKAVLRFPTIAESGEYIQM